MNHTDIIIVGAGLSGIGAACHLERKNNDKSYRILESREEIGGTWSLFKYPGIRSDSDMYTFGYSFKTWDNPKSFADAPSILKYLNEAADEYKIREKIQYQTRVSSVNFNTEKNIWIVTTTNSSTQIEEVYSCNMLFVCTGYYNYKNGYTPDFPGVENFKGSIIHPQHWPENLNYTNKKVVVIGSGATAVTIVPKMANETAKITMLQRSPTYVGAFPNKDKVAAILKSILPKRTAHKVIRFKNIVIQIIFFNVFRKWPKTMKKLLVKGVQKQLGDIPANPHFSPNYKPWDQRFCVAPDGDLFQTLKQGKADIVTDHIETFTEKGIKTTSGKELEADIVISATGLKLLAFGGAKISIDDNEFDISKSLTYRGLMLSGLPNCIFFAGYTNASWTLKSDLTSEYASRLLKFMDQKNYKYMVPKVIDEDLETIPLLNLNSGYIHRSENEFPRQGSKLPWRLYQNYFRDYKTLRINKLTDKELQFK
ncbi:MAG: NAD(P)/FAD-dependent oxidoreductase [Flavobacteriaceae bacterium]